MDLMDNERRVEEMLAADTPPTHALGDTTDYRQVVLAWARAHNLGFEEMVRQLETAGGPEAQRLIDDIRRDPGTEEIFREALKEPVSGDATVVGRDADTVPTDESGD